MQKLSKEELIKKYEDLQADYNNLEYDYGDLETANWDMESEIEELEGQLVCIEDLVDIDCLKEKLELYGFKTDELWNFLDTYMKLYNK